MYKNTLYIYILNKTQQILIHYKFISTLFLYRLFPRVAYNLIEDYSYSGERKFILI